ncbi:immunoglobulin-like domain-containing protein, partial [Pseudomonas inefficax]|nr:immunoglobulin-like domain-containing protein [Pseudomonas inefficax]
EPGTPGNPGTPGTPNGGDEVTLTLTGNTVQEGNTTTITGTLSHPAGQAFTVTLSNGQTLTFAKDATTATTAPFLAQSDDVYRRSLWERVHPRSRRCGGWHRLRRCSRVNPLPH